MLPYAVQAGVELDAISVPKPAAVGGPGGSGSALGAITIREVGSPMLPMWPSYYAECRAVVYVMDAAQPMGLAAATVELYELLAHPALTGKPILLVINKWLVCCHVGTVTRCAWMYVIGRIACWALLVTLPLRPRECASL